MLTNQQLLEVLRPYFPLVRFVFKSAFRDVRRAQPILGLPRKTERATDMHRAVREQFKLACECQQSECLELLEEREGLGLDYLVCHAIPDQPIAIRWVHYPNGDVIRRNRTVRQLQARGQGYLFSGLDAEDSEGLVHATFGYVLGDDYIEAGHPCWWLSRVALLREKCGRPDSIADVAFFGKPAQAKLSNKAPSAVVKSREADEKHLIAILATIERRSA